ncbi:hypothetical protein BC351_39025 [Paenibacillus ferrarius]|uniref:Uncharacterized protein n=1 Tax=Paenibacillus ferrarius TaxID=1469647 RepID=A0A1V4H9L4_9BACL|nr:hypothetical protein [Paenibacillus ferrarius]OPH47983.1 hypothetical protein BC351_39025 [Paenibacillus ferrarius]
MIKLALDKRVIPVNMGNKVRDAFDNSIIFYLINRNDQRPFFVNFVVIDFENNQLNYFDTYLEENIEVINHHPDQANLTLQRTPHRTVTITAGENFFTFIQEEQYFYYVNYKNQYVLIYTFDDFIKNKDYKLLKLSSTNYQDTDNPNYLYLSAIDEDQALHIYRVSLNLQEIEEIHVLPNQTVPPHTLRKYRDMLLLSHDFGNAQFINQNSGKMISSSNFAMSLQKRKMFKERQMRDQREEEWRKVLISEVFNESYEENPITCASGEVLTINLNNMEEHYYKTNGTSPAHFEIDEKTDHIYVSSHNFFVWNGKNIYVEPAVLDKFQIENGKLKLTKSFSHETGYRFTSHKFFYHQGKPYMCTFGQPNRLFVIDAEDMQLVYFEDIGQDELSSQSSIRDYINDRVSEFEIVGVEVSQNGNYIIFVCNEFIYLYDFLKREIIQKVPYINNSDDKHLYVGLDQYKIRTNHIDYL